MPGRRPWEDDRPMKLPKGKVLGKFPGRPGVLFDALAQAPEGLNGYLRVVGPEGTAHLGIVLLEDGEPAVCLVAAGEQTFGRASIPALIALSADPGSHVRLIAFYEETLGEARQTAAQMSKVAGITRADLDACREGAAPDRAPREAEAPTQRKGEEKDYRAAVAAVKATPEGREGAPPLGKDDPFFKELLETGFKAGLEESRASGQPLDPATIKQLESYLASSNLQLDDAIATFASVIGQKGPAQGAGPMEKDLPSELAQELSQEEERLEKTAKRYEFLLARDLASTKALRDQEESLAKMEGQLRDLKGNVQREAETKIRELEQLSLRADVGPAAALLMAKLKEEQEAIYARVVKLEQMEKLFRQNLLTQRKRVEQKEKELQEMANQLKSDFLERKRLLEEEKESYLEDLRRQSKDLKSREAAVVEREKKASELAAKLEGEVRQKIDEIERRRRELEEKEGQLRSQGEALARKQEKAERPVGERASVALSVLERQRAELAGEREAFARKIAELSKREGELRALEARLEEQRQRLEAAEKEAGGRMRANEEVRKLLIYLDSLLEALPPEKVDEFAKGEYYQLYLRVLERLGI